MIRRLDSQFSCTWLCLLLETSRRKSSDKPLLRERLWELGVMRTERRWQKEHQLASVRMHVHIRQTFSSSGQSTQEVEGTLQEEPSLSRLSSPLGDTRELWAMKRECLFDNRQHILHYATSLTSTSSAVKDNHVLLYYFKTGWFIYSEFHKASANY